LIDKKKSGHLHVEFAVCISNNSQAKALDRARDNNIPALHLPPSKFESSSDYLAELTKVLDSYGTEAIVLAGYMKMIPVEIIRRYTGKIINIHPALLPAFGGKGMYGHFVHDAVIAYGAKVSGVTVHFVDEQYDHGAVITQATIPVLDSDNAESLAKRVLAVEHNTYWQALEALALGQLTIRQRRVFGFTPSAI
jgi:phosphoribosylglycinamide formyltransferase-1